MSHTPPSSSASSHTAHPLTLRAAALYIRLRPREGGALNSGQSGEPRRPRPLLPLAPGALHVTLGHF